MGKVWKTGGQQGRKGTLSGKYGSVTQTPLNTPFNIVINVYTSACDGLRNATPNHAKRRGMVSLWIDGRLMFSIWRQNQDVKKLMGS